MFKKYNPSQFQGSKTKKGYFEGWYYKLVDASEKLAFAIIAGISLPKDQEKSHAFIMVFDARNHEMNYFKFDIDEFEASKSEFKLKIADNFFSYHQLHLNLNKDSLQIKARLDFKNITPWPVSVFSPGVMGWYSFVPFMECYHGVLSFNHQVNGYVEINNQKKDFNKGKGYLEKDWGTSMPSSWVWMQSNHFEEENASLFGSIAKIPWLKNYFTGFIFGFLLNGRLFKFSTYNRSHIKKLKVDHDRIIIEVSNKNHRLKIDAERTKGVDLPAPSQGEMTSKVNESLNSKIKLKLYDNNNNNNNKKNKLIFEGTGRNSGLEFVGDIQELIKGIKK